MTNSPHSETGYGTRLGPAGKTGKLEYPFLGHLTSKTNRKDNCTFNVDAFLNSAGLARTLTQYRKGQTIYPQGDSARSVLYIHKGGVKLSVVSVGGKEAIVALLGPGDFFGEGCLTGLPFRIGAATAVAPTTVLAIAKSEMIYRLHKEQTLSDHFISYLLRRNIRIEEDLVDQLFNSIEKRLARTLLLLAHYGKQDQPERVLPIVSQEMLAGMIGTTRSRVNVFMTKFKRLGFIHTNGGLHINPSLLSIVLRD